MTTKISVRVQELKVERFLHHRLPTSSSNLLLQMSKPFVKFSCNGKWKTVSNHLNVHILQYMCGSSYDKQLCQQPGFLISCLKTIN